MMEPKQVIDDFIADCAEQGLGHDLIRVQKMISESVYRGKEKTLLRFSQFLGAAKTSYPEVYPALRLGYLFAVGETDKDTVLGPGGKARPASYHLIKVSNYAVRFDKRYQLTGFGLNMAAVFITTLWHDMMEDNIVSPDELREHLEQNPVYAEAGLKTDDMMDTVGRLNYHNFLGESKNPKEEEWLGFRKRYYGAIIEDDVSLVGKWCDLTQNLDSDDSGQRVIRKKPHLIAKYFGDFAYVIRPNLQKSNPLHAVVEDSLYRTIQAVVESVRQDIDLFRKESMARYGLDFDSVLDRLGV